MKHIIKTVLTSLLLTLGLNAQAEERPSPTVTFNEQGFYLEAPIEATQLQLRLVSPERKVILDERTTGSSINWQLNGYETNGNYRYEAVIVVDNNGTPQQHNLSGSFNIEEGLLITPPQIDLTQQELTEHLNP